MKGGSDGVYCSVCEKEIDLRVALSIPHKCGCRSHNACLTVDSDFECARCVPTCKAALGKKPFEEPNPYPDFDWVLASNREYPEKIKASLKQFWGIGASHSQETESPTALLQTRMSLETIMQRRGWCMADFYFRRATLDDFLRNGYSLADLQRVSRDVRDRPLATLRKLGLTPDHLVEYEEDVFSNKQLNFTPQEIASKLTGGGMGYNPKTKCITTAASGAIWTVKELIQLGFVFDDLVCIGVNTFERWQSLGNMSRKELAALGARPQDIASLPREFEEEPEEEGPVPMSVEEVAIPVQQASKLQKAANAIYMQPRRRFVK